MNPVAIVPAAGKAERFGGAKLVAPIGDDVLLDRTLRSLLDGGLHRIVVVVAPGADLGAARLLADPRVTQVRNPDPSRGMFSSIHAGLDAAQGDPILVLPGDMPFVLASTVAAVCAACARDRGIVIPTHNGHRGHPVAFPASIVPALLRAGPGSTLKAALAATGVASIELAVDDPGVLRDVDVPGDLSL
jgi:molybdenum cofactor cytidylyltransferase